MSTISVIGLGKLGAPMVAAFASKGYRVIGVDLNAKAVAALNAGKAPMEETNLEKTIRANRARISATTDVRKAVMGSDITFIIVPTPSGKDGSFVTTFAAQAARQVGQALRAKKGYHLVALTSTVLPQACQRDIVPVLEQASGKTCGKDFGFCYNPEFIALGSVIRDLLNPDFILIGESDPKAGSILEKFYRKLHRAPVRRMAIVNAELAKVAVNSFITKKIAFANLLAQICDHLPGGDVDAVTGAIGSDARIGSKYLKGGLGFGGPCFPRDNRAFASVARSARTGAHLPVATDRHNRDHLQFALRRVAALTPKGGRIALLGVTYKPESGVTEESHGLALAVALARRGFHVACYDPSGPALPRAAGLTAARTQAAALKGASTVCIATPWQQFRSLASRHLPVGATVVDFWRILDPALFPRHRIVHPGINRQA